MNEIQFTQVWEKLKTASGFIEKDKLLKEISAEEFGRFVLKWAYDPFITFGITPVALAAKEENSGGFEFDIPSITSLLDNLASRHLTGHAAIEKVQDVMNLLTDSGRKILFAILSKDLKSGIAAASINSAMPGLIPVFSVMRAHSYDAKRVKKWPVVGEPKLDGYRTTFRSRDGSGGFFSRSGTRWPAMDFMVPIVMAAAKRAFYGTSNLELKRILAGEGDNFVLDGEALIGLFENAGKLRGKSEQAEDAELHVFDIMSGADFDAIGSVGSNFVDRRKMVVEFFKWADVPQIQITPGYYLNDDDQVQEYFDKFLNQTLASYLARGDAGREAELLLTTIDKATGKPKTLEGMIVKQTDWAYDKKKSYGWMKMKAEDTEDLPIVGVVAGDKGTKYENCMGAVIVDRKGVEVRVGGGWSDQERLDVWAQWLADDSIHTAAYIPKILGRLIEVKFNEVTPDGSLRHPRFLKFRDDKAGEIESR